MAKGIIASCLMVALTLGLLGATAARADDTGHHETVVGQDSGIKTDPPDRLERDGAAEPRAAAALKTEDGDQQRKPKRGRRHRPLGTGARNRAAQSRPGDAQGTRDSPRFLSIFSYAPGGTYVVKSVSDGNSSSGGHSYGGVGGSSGFAASFSGGGGGGGFSGFSGGGASRSSGGAPSPELDTLLGFFIVVGTLAFIKRRRGNEIVADAAAA